VNVKSNCRRYSDAIEDNNKYIRKLIGWFRVDMEEFRRRVKNSSKVNTNITNQNSQEIPSKNE